MSRPDSATSSSSSSTSSSTSCPATSSAQLRKIKKPMIERRRRERINVCLNQLKSLVLEALKKNESSYSKMEKADILEMTVTHLKSLQHCHLQNDPKVRGHESARGHDGATYISGFRECANVVEKFLTTINPTDRPGAEVLSSLIVHLRERIGEVQKDVGNSSVQLHPVLDSSSFMRAESLTQFQTVPQPSEIMTQERSEFQSTMTAGTNCFQVNDSSVPVSANTRTRYVLGQLPYLQHPYAALTAILPMSSRSNFVTAATSTVTKREHVQSPTQGDEFPQTLGVQFPPKPRIPQFWRDCQISPDLGISLHSPTQIYCSKSVESETSANFFSRSIYKVEPISQLETKASGPSLERLWRPW